jgi:butyryl-CoA dehydrogenase
MDAEEREAFRRSLDRLVRAELGAWIERLDERPETEVAFELHDRWREAGLLELCGQDAAAGLPDMIDAVAAISEHCAGFGASAAQALVCEHARRALRVEVEPGAAALCWLEPDEEALDVARPLVTASCVRGEVTGSKLSVIGAPSARWLVVLCRAGAGNVLAWVERGASGVELSAPVGMLGIRVVRCADVRFARAACAAERALEPGTWAGVLAVAGLLSAACACATAASAVRQARAYAHERVQGGGTIERYDAVRAMAVEGEAALEAGFAALRSAAASGCGSARDAARALGAKAQASRAAVQAALDAIQILGGYGYMRDYGVEKRFRDAVTLSLQPIDNTRALLAADALRDAGSGPTERSA